MSEIVYKIGSPKEFSESEKKRFRALLVVQGKVSKPTIEKVNRCYLLCLCILLETKGDHLDAEQKIRLGGLWASKAGNNYRYFMVYEKRVADGAYKLEDFLTIIKDI
jgi:hypothetical protein